MRLMGTLFLTSRKNILQIRLGIGVKIRYDAIAQTSEEDQRHDDPLHMVVVAQATGVEVVRGGGKARVAAG